MKKKMFHYSHRKVFDVKSYTNCAYKIWQIVVIENQIFN